MTKEEAIHCMKSYLPENTYETCMNCKYYGSCRSSVAHGMAIKALGQLEPCEDAVSREEAKWGVFCNRDHVKNQANAIDELPSAQKKGYTKADYVMALHKEYGCSLARAEEAHQKALEYLRNTSMMKG